MPYHSPEPIPVMDEDAAFMSFFRHNTTAMWVFDVHTLAFLDVNYTAVAQYGYDKEQFLNMTLTDIRKESRPEAFIEYVQTYAHTNTDNSHWEHVKADSSVISVSLSTFRVIYRQREATLVTITNISPAVRQKQELRKANRELSEYKHAITSSAIVSITDRRGIIEYVNDHFVTISGYSREELLGNTHRMLSSGAHPGSFWESMWRTISKGEVWRGEVCNRKKDGGFYWVDSSVIPIHDEDGAIQRIMSIRNDITQRKEKELHIQQLNSEMHRINEALKHAKQEQEHLSLVARLTGNKVMITDASSAIQWVNASFEQKTGFTLAEAKGKKPGDILYGPLSNVKTSARISKAILEGRPFKEEMVYYSKTGEKCWMLLDGQPVKDDQGNILEYIMVDTDITALKEKETAVALSEMKLDTLLNSTNSLHLLFNEQLELQAFNQAAIDFAEKWLHHSLFTGMKLTEIITGTLQQHFVHFSRLALSGTNTLNKEVQITEDIWWLVNYMTVCDSFKNIMGVAFTAVDITQLKKAEEKISRQNYTLKNIAWKQSHIVRAPVSNILAISQLLKYDPADPDLLHSLQRETGRLDTIIRDIVIETASIYNAKSGHQR